MRLLAALLASVVLTGCYVDDSPGTTFVLSSDEARVVIEESPFSIQIQRPDGETVLASAHGDGAYASASATVDAPFFSAKSLPGWDGYEAGEAPWRAAKRAHVRELGATSATVELEGDDVAFKLEVSLEGARVRLHVEALESADGKGPGSLNKSSLAFALGEGERFFGLGERFASVDHRGLSLYSWAEEGGLGQGETTPEGVLAPYPNGPSMTYFPVPFMLSSRGYGVLLDTTFRSELHLGSETEDAWRAAVNASGFSATVYVHADPLGTIADYTEDTGRPPVPAPWVFGPRRRVNRGAQALGVDEYLAMRQRHIPVTGIDDALHFLPASSQLGNEDAVAQWTHDLHAAGYKAMAYNNPYVAEDNDNAAADYAYGKEHGYFVKGPDGEPTLTQFISGKLLTIAAVDLTNPDAVAWYQDLLRRTLSLGYDGWMHDFGEYTPRDAVFFDGRRGDEVHDEYPVLSAKAAHDLLEKERPGDYLFFVRSGYKGTQQYVPAVWGGDAEATFDDSQGLPSSVRGGLNLSMSGVPYWGSDMTGFKCITDAPNDKEVFLRWVEFGSVSPIMMEQDACSNPIEKKTKWKLWNDDETIEHYAKYARLHTRLEPYFLVLAGEAHATGKPITLHPFLTNPDEPAAFDVDDAYWLGPALYASPVVRRGQVEKETWLPPGLFVDLDDLTVYDGGQVVTIPAPLGKLPLLLSSEQILPLLDPSIDTLAPATDPTVVTLDDVADRIDVMVALPSAGKATMVLADGTELTAERAPSDQGNPAGLIEVSAEEIGDCGGCLFSSAEGDVERWRVTTELGQGSSIAIGDLTLTVKGGPLRRVRWDVLKL
jgi:sulfoquinovosidase